MSQILSLSFRPRTFSEMVGVDRVVSLIRGHYENERMPQAWLFAGQTRSGKTTIARILSLALQCPHQEKLFGEPCELCYEKKSGFHISEVNASEVSGVAEVGRIAQTSTQKPWPPSQYRVYIMDEAQRLSDASQNLLLKYVEEAPKKTVWIFCTTDPQKILRTLRARCVYYAFHGLDVRATEELVYTAMKFAGAKPSQFEPDALVKKLAEYGVTAPGLILMAVEKLLAGAPPEEAVQVELESTFDTLKACRLTLRGDWKGLHQILKTVSPEDARCLLYALIGYLKSVILQPQQSKSTAVAAEAILALSRVQFVDDGVRQAVMIATLHDYTSKFAGLNLKVLEPKKGDDDEGDDH